MDNITKILILILLSASLQASNDVILKLDTQGHTGAIWDVIITKNKDIITASVDKTIRVFDSKTGQEKRKILGEIGSGPEGTNYAIALSSNEQYLAVGGYLSYDGNRAGAIRIYSYSTGKLLKVLKSHTSSVYDLAFSKDGKFLISGSHDKSAKIWDVTNDFALLDTLVLHTKELYGVNIIKKAHDYFAVTAGVDNQIVLYDMQKRSIVKNDSSDNLIRALTLNDKLNHIAVSGFGKEILIYDYDLNFIKKISSETDAVGLAYSKNGEFLIAGTYTSPRNVNIYKAKQNYKKKSSFKKHTGTTLAVGFLDSKTALSAGGNNYEIYIWDINSAKVKKNIEGVGDRVWSVGIEGNSVAWGNVWTKTKGQSKLQKSINLKTFKITNTINSNFNRIQTINGNYSLTHSKGGGYGFSDAVLNIKKYGSIKEKIVKDTTNGYRHGCYGWYKDLIISGGENGHLKIYNKNGDEVASLVGHTGMVWSIAVDGDRLVSGSGDQTMMVWDLSTLGSEKKLFPLVTIFVSKDNEWVVWSQSGYFNSSVGGDKYVGYHINRGADKAARYVGSDKYFDTLYRPDIIAALVETGSEKKAIAFAGKTKKVKTVDIASSLPPVVSLLSSSDIKTSKKSITVKFSVQSDEDIKEIIIIHNGERLNTRGLKRTKSKDSKTITVELDSGENIISIKARNKFAMSDEVLVYATKTSDTKNIYKPTLYMLSVGVSKYENSEYNLGVADKDATAMAKMFKAQKGKIYKDVVLKTLTNSNATQDNILDGLDWIDKEATSKDVVVIFIAGHGVNDDKGSYYFLSHDANLEKLRRTAVKWIEIEDTISNLPSKVILLADTCHSGNITGTRRDITSAIKSIINSGSGSVIMTATTGSGYSYEQPDWGHGAFTKALLEGVGQTKADYDNDGTVTIKEIDLYVTNRVKKLTKGKQKPTTIIPNSVPDFAVGVK